MNKPIWLRSTAEQKTVLITLLMLANHEQSEWEWQGKKFKVNPGQFVTSLDSIKNNCGKGISTQNIRSALTRFKKLEFLTEEVTKTGRVITILNWQSYQITKEEHNIEANKEVTKTQQRGNKEATPIKNNKKEKNDKNVKEKKLFFENVYLTDDEFSKLEKVHGKFWTGKMIEILNNYKASSGKKYKSDYHAILSWVVSKVKDSPDYAAYRTKKMKQEQQQRESLVTGLHGKVAERIPDITKIGRKVPEIEDPDNTPEFK